MIATSKITMRFGKTALFEDVSVKFVPGNRYGLIGANGSGKTTFMKILAGQLDQTEGVVSVGHGCTLGYLRQDHSAFDEQTIIDTVYTGNSKLWKLHCEREYLYSKDELTDEENDRCGHIEEEFGDAGGYTMEAEAASLLIGLGFTEDLFGQKMTVLQGGFKLRVLLAQVLFGQPDILLLDEPTNHLDVRSRESLEAALQDFTGTVIVVSHDRRFLDKVVGRLIVFPDVGAPAAQQGRLSQFAGNYTEWMDHRARRREQERESRQPVSGTRRPAEQVGKPTPSSPGGKPALSKNEIRRREQQIGLVEDRIKELETEQAAAVADMADPATGNDERLALARRCSGIETELGELMARWEQLHGEIEAGTDRRS